VPLLREKKMNTKEQLFDEVRGAFKKLLPDVDQSKVELALEACYEDGICKLELTKITYAYLYPPREPTLWD
jgi:hypothetical protein